jgi:hypothetical protein
MICPITVGATFDCDDRKNAAGSEYWCYVGNRSDITFVRDTVTNAVEDITMVATKKLYKLSGPQKAIDASVEKQTSDVAGTISYKLTVSLMLSAMDQIAVNALQGLVEANDLVFFIPTKGKHVFIYGVDGGMVSDTFKESLGKQGTDNNLADVTFVGESNSMKVEVYLTASTTTEGNYTDVISTLEGLLL